MKKILAALLCALLSLTPVVQAESTNPFSLFPTPAPSADVPEESAPPAFGMPAPSMQEGGSMSLTVRGETLTLDFDSDPLYSMLDDGYIQASFYALDAMNALYELYLIFPAEVAAGSMVTPTGCIADGMLDSGVILYITEPTSSLYANASQDEYGIYPEDSAYVISFDEVTRAGSSCTFSGSVEATLIALDTSYNPLHPVENLSATFQFTMDLSGASTPNSDGDESIPHLPGLITPPDAQKI